MLRDPRARGGGAGKRLKVAVLHNVDFEDSSPDGDPGWAARADVESVALATAQALEASGVEIVRVPVDGDLTAMRDALIAASPDCVFNLCESIVGDARLESAAPLVCELLGFPITGSSAEVLSLALYKDRVKDVLRRAGVPTPDGCLLRRPDDPCSLPFPLIAKPVREDGSVGIASRSVVYDDKSLRAVAEEVIGTFKQPCLVEQYIEGRELNVALLGFPSSRVLPLSEIDFSQLPATSPRIVSYEAKWTADHPEYRGTQPVLHPTLPTNVAARVRRVALEAFRAVGLRDYGRVDLRLSAAGVPYVIDVNPNCDLSPTAGMARGAAAVGIEYGALVRLLVRYALRRRVSRLEDERAREREQGNGEPQHSQARARRSIAPG